MPADSAMVSAGAVRLSENSATISIGSRPSCCAASSAANVAPRPEARTATRRRFRSVIAESGNAHALVAGAGGDFADNPCPQVQRGQPLQHVRDLVTADDQRVSYSTIECSPHFPWSHPAFTLQPVEHGGQLPCRAVQHDAKAIRYDAD